MPCSSTAAAVIASGASSPCAIGSASATVTLRGISARASAGARPSAFAANAVENSEKTLLRTVAPTISGKWRRIVPRCV